ncbi:MAG TPA: hypothetical protein VHW46_06940, partial [Terracidiphilus sp.]|nr:hypothetical protein [Terracidiphilus sp.]
EIDKPSIASSHNCVMIKSSSTQQPNAVHVHGGEFDSCANGWYHNDTTAGILHVAEGNSVENAMFEGVTNPIIDTASVAFRITSNYIEVYSGAAIVLGSTQNTTLSAHIAANYFHTTTGATISFINTFNSIIEAFLDEGSPSSRLSQTSGSSENIILPVEGVTVTTQSGLGTGSPSAVCDTADSFQCTWSYGVLTLVVGTTPVVGDVAQITWVTPWSTPPVCVFSNISGTYAVIDDASWRATTSVKLFTSAVPSGTAKIMYQCGN